ncbi:hypothetical protein JZ751_023550 [Albula glossodonta]|uniref:Ig-like domain-containing protein n=1 Tax=Albula glossodonta TaxID=121402 RepID=A0A8T2MSS7_9TELE|nr:hypothetical protein JZ751_023550 [Albula glossodonta]
MREEFHPTPALRVQSVPYPCPKGAEEWCREVYPTPALRVQRSVPYPCPEGVDECQLPLQLPTCHLGPSHPSACLLTSLLPGVCYVRPQSRRLKCTVGERVFFHTAVEDSGFLYKEDSQIAKVINGQPRIPTDDVQWDNSTRLFSITELQTDDSGNYKVETLAASDSVYQLTVYRQLGVRLCVWPVCCNETHYPNPEYKCSMEHEEPPCSVTHRVESGLNPVSTPQVSSRNKMKPTCSVLCSVENGREVTLSWQREGETLNYTSSPDLNTPLSLPLEIEENSAPYSCVAKNPARAKTVRVRPEEFCFEEARRVTTCSGTAEAGRVRVRVRYSVSKPRITSTAAEGYQGRYCSLLCSVENGREVTLSWQREGETLSHTSSPDLNTPLSLPLEIEVSNITYSCVAKNPASEERTVFYPSQHCREKGGHSHDAVVYIVLVLRLVEFVLVTLAVLLLIRLYREGRVLTQHQHR